MGTGGDESIKLCVTAGHPHDEAFSLRLSPEYADEVIELLDAHGLSHSRVIEFSAGVDLLVLAIQAGTPAALITSLTVVIKAFLTRHKDKSVQLTRDGTIVKGYSRKEVQKVLEDVAKEQAKRDADWDRLLEGRKRPDKPRSD